jgi:hypothetical protein
MATESKIPSLIIKNSQKLIQQLIPSISQIASRTGIQNIGQPNMALPSSCLTPEELQAISNLRNSLVTKLNTISKTIETLSKPISILSTTVNTTSTIIKTTDATRIAANIALAAIPPTAVPGTIPAAINTLKDITDFLKPNVQSIKNQVSSISGALDYANNIIFKITGLLNTIDQYLIGCGVSSENLTSPNDYVNKVNQQYTAAQTSAENTDSNSQVYEGFTLEVVEEPFSPTVNRRKAVAKNSSGIILLQTPLSFTSTPQVLIQQLKLIIDNSNLKAV